MSVIIIYGLPNAVFDSRLFQISGETGSLFTALVSQGTKKCMLSTARDLSEDMSHCFILALEV